MPWRYLAVAVLALFPGCAYDSGEPAPPREEVNPHVVRQDDVDSEIRTLPFKYELNRFSLGQNIRSLTLGGHYLYIETEDHELIAMDRFSFQTQWRWKIKTTAPLDFPPVESLDEIDGRLVPASAKIAAAEAEIERLTQQINVEIKRTTPRLDEVKALQADWDKMVAEFEKAKTDKGSEHQDVMKLRGELDDLAKKLEAIKIVPGPDMTKIEALRKQRRDAESKRREGMDNDNVYCVSKTNLYCLSRLPQPRYTQQLLWSKHLEFVPSATPFATRSYVYCPSVDHDRVWALAVNRQGFEQGFFEVNPLLKQPDPYVLQALSMTHDIATPPIYMGEHLYFLSRSGLVYKYSDKREIRSPWPYDTKSDLQAAPAIHFRKLAVPQTDGKPSEQPFKFLFVGTITGSFLALDADSGGLHWRYEVGHPVKQAPVAKDDTVYVKTENGYLFALNIWPMVKDAKGQIYWETRTNEKKEKERIWGPKRNGDLRWKLPLGERFLVKGKDRVYVLGPNRVIYAMDEMTGVEKGRYAIEHLDFLLTNVQDELFYAATRQGHIYALRESKSEY